jgi:hypothetical protein
MSHSGFSCVPKVRKFAPQKTKLKNIYIIYKKIEKLVGGYDN